MNNFKNVFILVKMRRIFLSLFICCCCMGIAQESYALSSESVLTITGTSTVHDWEVIANTVNGSLIVNEEIIKDIKIKVQIAEIKSERGPTMDKKMHAALKAEEYPTIIFALKEVNANAAFIGKLTIAGVEREISVEGAIENKNNKIGISGAKKILLKDYEMEPPTAMFGQIVVGEVVTVNFDLIFLKE